MLKICYFFEGICNYSLISRLENQKNRQSVLQDQRSKLRQNNVIDENLDDTASSWQCWPLFILAIHWCGRAISAYHDVKIIISFVCRPPTLHLQTTSSIISRHFRRSSSKKYTKSQIDIKQNMNNPNKRYVSHVSESYLHTKNINFTGKLSIRSVNN